MKKYAKTQIIAENIKDYNHQYYNNIQKPKYNNNKIHCNICNSIYTEWNKYRHLKSDKHIKALENVDFNFDDVINQMNIIKEGDINEL